MSTLNQIRAWHASIRIAVGTRELTAHFPPRGYSDLRDQMIRAAESIGNNIAEGHGSGSEREYARFLDMAARSASELSSQLVMTMEYRIVPKWDAFNLNGTVICARRMIETLREQALSKGDAPR